MWSVLGLHLLHTDHWKFCWSVRFVLILLFELPNEQTALCFDCLFIGFSVRRWLTKGLKAVHFKMYMDLVNDLRYSYTNDDES